MSEEADRVRANTAQETNRTLDEEAARRIERYAQHSAEAITRRMEELDREWDTERILEMNASALAFTGLMLGITRNNKWLILPSIVLPFLFSTLFKAGVLRFPSFAGWVCGAAKKSTAKKPR